MTRDEMMEMVEGAVTKHSVAVANIHRGEGPLSAGPRTRAALLTAIGACLDWVPDCEGCVHLGSTEPGAIIACRYCPRNAVFHDHYAREGGEDDDE